MSIYVCLLPKYFNASYSAFGSQILRSTRDGLHDTGNKNI